MKSRVPYQNAFFVVNQ